MKRNLKKLVLNKESIRQLNPTGLNQVVGGIIKTGFDGPCSYTNQQCGTGTQSVSWCTSQLCPTTTAVWC